MVVNTVISSSGDTSPRQGPPPVGSVGVERGMNGSPSTSCASLERSGRSVISEGTVAP